MQNEAFDQLAFAHGGPVGRGVLRHLPEDFIVEEDLGFEPDGEGEHVMLQLRKRNANTEWVGRQLARLAGVKPVDVGFAGLKDRNALTTQWFSINLAGRPEPAWSELESDEIEILQVARHRRKLKRGALRGNRFVLALRAVEGEREAIAQRLEAVAARGVPNYFGEQRFGREGNNLARAEALFAGKFKERDRHKRGMYISAARSYLFNRVLSLRVERELWDRPVAGDIFVLDGRRGFFLAEAIDAETADRVARGEIHPSGPLWGRGTLPTVAEAAALEREALGGCEMWEQGLETVGLEMERRPLRLPVGGLGWDFPEADQLRLSFRLQAGSYATAVLREIISTE